MSLLNRLFKKRSPQPQGARQSSEMDFDTYRNRVLRFLWFGDNAGLRRLCEEQVVITPIFIENAIEEIKPGNQWNDVLWLMAKNLIVAGDWPLYKSSLEKKRHLVPNPDGGKEVMAPFVVVSDKPVSEKNLNYPAVLLRLLNGDMTGIDHTDDRTIDRMFADQVLLGPGFYQKYLANMDFPYGARAMLRIPLGTPPREEVFEGRVLFDKARLVPLVYEPFEDILARYRNGQIREATDEERDLFYTLIDFEIAGRPVHVVQSEEGRLLVYLQEKDRIHWIEYLDIWKSGGKPSSLGSLDRSTLDALGKDFK